MRPIVSVTAQRAVRFVARSQAGARGISWVPDQPTDGTEHLVTSEGCAVQTFQLCHIRVSCWRVLVVESLKVFPSGSFLGAFGREW